MIFLNLDQNWLSSSGYSQVPVRAEVFGMMQQDGANPYQFHHIYDYTDFTTTLDPLTTVFEVLPTTLISFEIQVIKSIFNVMKKNNLDYKINNACMGIVDITYNKNNHVYF